MHRFEQGFIEATDGANAEFSMFLQKIKKKHREVYVILAPPRSSSAVFARVFWEHPSIGFYCHEPFDLMYHKGLDLNHVIKALEYPLNLNSFKRNYTKSNNLVIKAMSFQVGQDFHLLASLTKNPIMFVIRDPRLAFSSRMKKLAEGRQNPIFPLAESGWISLNSQIQQCKKLKIPYLVFDARDFRNSPKTIFEKACEKLGLIFSNNILSWKSVEDMDLGNLGDEQKHWYQRILVSTGIQAANEPVPEIDSFPETDGFRVHVKKCLEVYKNLRNDVNLVLP